MNYRVIYTDSFLEDVGIHADYLREQHAGAEVIERWYSRLFDMMPRRFPVDEVQTHLNRCETRKMNYGDYLAFYQIDDDRKQVYIVGFMHGARRRAGEARDD